MEFFGSWGMLRTYLIIIGREDTREWIRIYKELENYPTSHHSEITKDLEKEYTNMALFTITQDDLNKGKLVEPAVWYPVEVVKVEDKTAKTSGADMILVHLLITAGDFKGTTLYQNFMPDFPGFIIDFLAAIHGVERTKEFEAKILNNPIEVSDKSVKGKKLEVYVTRGSYNNKPNNQIEGYRPAA